MDIVRQKEAYARVDSSIAQAEQRVRDIGMHAIEHGYDTNNKSEAAIRGLSVLSPNGYDLVPIALSQEVIGAGKSGGKILQPSPRRVFDFDSVCCKVVVVDTKGSPIDVESDIIYSQPDNGNDG